MIYRLTGHTKSIARVAKLCLLLTTLPVGVDAREISAGKYFCFVSHMVGITLNNNGQIYSGDIKPTEEKFFIDIHPAPHPEELCKSESPTFVDWWLCRAKWEVQIMSNGHRLRSDVISAGFVGGYTRPDYFLLNQDGSFHSNQSDLLRINFYTSDGKCTSLSKN